MSGMWSKDKTDRFSPKWWELCGSTKKKFPVAVAVAAVAGVAVIAGGAVYAVKTDRIALPGALSAKQKQLDDMSVAEAAKNSEVTKMQRRQNLH